MPHRRRKSTLALIGALGVVFGDIGTSPLYAMRSILGEAGSTDQATVYGLTSAVIWSLLGVVTFLYVGLLLRVDNEGEGGLLALLGLVRRHGAPARATAVLTVLAIIGAAAFLGDGVVTPAISVLAAAEGLETASSTLAAAVLPVALLILIGIFVLQRVGSGRIGAIYGPVMALWFAMLAGGGLAQVLQDPGVVQALSPHWAIRFFLDEPVTGFAALSAVILAVTGAEAIYADLGHFGRTSIARAWLFVVLPALVIAYLGEASAVTHDPAAANDPFYAVVPGWATVPVLVLATLATVIASEAVIAGAFTVLHQAGGLGLFPFLRTRHPSAAQGGRIYLPAANWTMAVAVLVLVLAFRSSTGLADAYGLAVAVTIVMTVALFVALDRVRAGRLTGRQVAGGIALLVMTVFVVATLRKLASGAWVPAGIAAVLVIVMSTWWDGRRRLAAARRAAEGPPDRVLDELGAHRQAWCRAPGTAVFLTENKDVAPFGLRVTVEAVRVLPERVVLLSWAVADTPRASPRGSSVEIDTFEGRYDGVLGVAVTLGYRERLDVERVLAEACERERRRTAGVDATSPVYVVSDPIPQLSREGSMRVWRQRIFLAIDRLATDRIEQLALPRDRTVVIGREFDL